MPNVLRLPKLSLPPNELQSFYADLAYDRAGLTAYKVNARGDAQEKTFFIDPLGTQLCYVPSHKSLRKSGIPFRSVVELRTAVDATSGLAACCLVGMFPLTITIDTGRIVALLIPDETSRDRLEQLLVYLIRRCCDAFDEDSQLLRTYELWIAADRTRRGLLSYVDVQRVLSSLSIDLSVAERDALLRDFDLNNDGLISFTEFTDLLDHVTQHAVLKPLFVEFGGSSDSTESLLLLTPAGLESFFREAQGERLPQQLIQQMICYYTKTRNAPGIRFDHFSSFLTDPLENGWIMPRASTVYQPMNQPFHNYYIATSHATCLTGRQDSPDADGCMIAAALLHGCRVLDIELWDAGDVEPVVSRGAASGVPLRNVFEVIAQHAFEVTAYPLFIIIEVHCGDDLLFLAASLIRSTLGSCLARWSDTEETQASPVALKNKIIIVYKDGIHATDCCKSVAGCAELEARVNVDNLQSPPLVRSVGFDLLVQQSGYSLRPLETTSPSFNFKNGSPSIFQLSTDRADRLGEQQSFLREPLVRVVPDMQRYSDSSNVPFTHYVGQGVSMVSINYHVYDEPARSMEAFFRQNGGCGYVLKPKSILQPFECAPCKLLLSVTVIAGIRIPFPEPLLIGAASDEAHPSVALNPYVVVKICGTASDMNINPQVQTNVVKRNSFNPVWNQTFRFVLQQPDIAVVMLRVVTQSNPIDLEVATASAPLSILRLGYRAVPLCSCMDGSSLNAATLICHFSLDHVPSDPF